ncbi:mitochondrial substrate carrier family protein [Heterostelium album PN500]|uniref:Mitochondrial substrate carrier family protein n=1 Tax=Heterostelium pallidum (strain ATCC 26659 / Pp 5 / PN500) TaxID=670386 RepID=D3B8B0_HETP5|nr:mitochondrial substrate carrier family protein [Heterostelium album PN500]EFA82278.1 mitochondrial substrate carrier family protein [Heterostelium album PN500]|eukprot:XP_020434395.1 mitochondrial substrate carrier family protein [Heterostelium album PN500]
MVILSSSHDVKNDKWIDMFAGSISGATTRMIVAPLDVIKIRLQLQKSGGSATSTSPPQYRGVFNTLGKITREEGIRALWKGNLSAEFLWISYATAQFSLYNSFVHSLDQENYLAHQNSNQHYKPPTYISLLAGATAGSIATAISYPFDTLRTNIVAQHQHVTIPQCVRQIYHTKGYIGFYKGITSSVLQIIPQISLQFASYEWLKNLYIHIAIAKEQHQHAKNNNNNNNNSIRTPRELSKDPIIQLLSGGSSGAISKFIVLPFDVVKKRMQVAPGGITLKQCISDMFKNEGWRAFYKGGVPSMIKAGAAASLSFTFYEQAKTLLTDMLFKII